MIFPAITLVGSLPVFYKIKVTSALNDVATGITCNGNDCFNFSSTFLYNLLVTVKA